MKQFIVNRIISGIFVIFGLSIFSFLLIHFVPGDPVRIMLGVNATPESIENLTNQLGLNEPLLTQYSQFISNAFQGDLGTSLKSGRPVLVEILERFPETMKLAFTGLMIAVVTGITMGVIAARYKDRWIDTLFTGLATLGISIPSFWLGMILIIVFSVNLGWFPIANDTGLIDMVLPSLTLGVLASTMISRITRNGMVEVLSNEYIRTARAKGLNDRYILFQHALRNVLIPVVTLVGLQLASLLGGTVIIETVFSWPGLGTLAVDAIMSRDFPLIQGTVLFMGVVYVIINILVDILYGVIDPRVELSSKEAK